MEEFIFFSIIMVIGALLLTWTNHIEHKKDKEFKEQWATKPLFRVSKITVYTTNKTSYVVERKTYLTLGGYRYFEVETFDNEKEAIDACDRLNKLGKYEVTKTEVIH